MKKQFCKINEDQDRQAWERQEQMFHQRQQQQPVREFRLVLNNKSLNKSTLKYIINNTEGYDPITLLNMVKEKILNRFRKNPQTKIRVVLSRTMVKLNPATGEETRDNAHFRGYSIYEGTDLDELYQKMVDKIL